MRLFVKPDRGPGAPFEADRVQAGEWNRRGYGVFWVLNPYRGARLAENCTGVRWVFCEMDGGTKEEQWKRVCQADFPEPSRVVESRNGWHLYWELRGQMPPRLWDQLVKGCVVPAYGADPKSSDPLRLLRATGFYHNKQEPFLVEEQPLLGGHRVYRPEELLDCVPRAVPKKRPEPSRLSNGFWESVRQLDGRVAIERVSGSWLVNGERFALDENHSGTANVVRVKPTKGSTPVFVNEHGRLCGVDGGDSIAAFCAWYGHEYKEVAEGLKELFPELEE